MKVETNFTNLTGLPKNQRLEYCSKQGCNELAQGICPDCGVMCSSHSYKHRHVIVGHDTESIGFDCQ